MAKYVETISERDARLERENARARIRNAQTRERRAEERRIKKQRRQALNRATSTSQRREIKKAAEDAIFAISGFSSSGGNQKGGIYDLSTDNYTQPKRNQTDQNFSIGETGIDTLGGNSDGELEFDDSGFPEGYSELDVTICINGTPTSGTILFKSS
jgi:hypothetical protein